MITERFEIPPRLKSTGIVLLSLGILTFMIGLIKFIFLGETDQEAARFWTVLLQNSVYFLFVSSISIFIMSAAALAQGGWIVAYRRIPEAIGANVWVFGLIALVVLFC